MLIFDSGVGGLFILKIIKKFFPKNRYIYVLDNQAFPYGNKTELFIIERSIKIINRIKQNYPINIVIIACNTASTIALSILRKKFTFPIIGVFPSIELAEKKTKNKTIGLIATKATVNSFYTKKIIHKKNSQNTIKVIGTNKLALMSENKIRGIKISIKKLKHILNPWIRLTIKPDTIILGCTHFLLLIKEIQCVLNTPSIHFIDSTELVISQIKHYFHTLTIKQKIKVSVFLYSQNNKELENLLQFIEQYKFQIIKHINLD